MESGDTKDMQNNADQPNEAVAADLEINTDLPQSESSGQAEFYVDEAGDQEKPSTNMTHEQSYAAFRKEQGKRKDKAAELKKEIAERERLTKEVEQLKAQVGTISRGEMPDPFDFDDKHAHYKAVKEWENSGQSDPQPSNKSNEAQKPNRDDEADFYLYQKEQELLKSIPSYQESKGKVIELMSSKYGVSDTDQVLNSLSSIARQSGVDIAKAFLAMEKIPSLIDELDASAGNPFAVSEVLRKAASKVKSRGTKAVETKPEPNINNSGPINNANKEIEKLRQEWVKNTTVSNHKKYQAAKLRAKSNG